MLAIQITHHGHQQARDVFRTLDTAPLDRASVDTAPSKLQAGQQPLCIALGHTGNSHQFGHRGGRQATQRSEVAQDLSCEASSIPVVPIQYPCQEPLIRGMACRPGSEDARILGALGDLRAPRRRLHIHTGESR
jgi:hypothetical protein